MLPILHSWHAGIAESDADYANLYLYYVPEQFVRACFSTNSVIPSIERGMCLSKFCLYSNTHLCLSPTYAWTLLMLRHNLCISWLKYGVAQIVVCHYIRGIILRKRWKSCWIAPEYPLLCGQTRVRANLSMGGHEVGKSKDADPNKCE